MNILEELEAPGGSTSDKPSVNRNENRSVRAPVCISQFFVSLSISGLTVCRSMDLAFVELVSLSPCQSNIL